MTELMEKQVIPEKGSVLKKLGIQSSRGERVFCLAGNPNTGKSTLFNALTGLHQHTGNWPGKTIARAEGSFSFGDAACRLIDLPGTYSLLSASPDEEVARDFILFGQPDVTIVVVDATRLERNLNLVLQVLQITDRVVVALNLMDEARAHGVEVDAAGLAKDLGVPVIPMEARQGVGIDKLLVTLVAVADGITRLKPRRISISHASIRPSLDRIVHLLEATYPRLSQPEWIAMRLLEGDEQMLEAVKTGELAALVVHKKEERPDVSPEQIATLLAEVDRLRWGVPSTFRDKWAECVYAESAAITERNVKKSGITPRQTWERRVDKLLTNRVVGMPIMIALLGTVLWITIIGANVPSSLLAQLLIDQGHPFLKELLGSIAPAWLTGVVVDGMYLTTAWVISVMLPPMAIFFPLFTILEDFGYLPRVAFNLDHLFQRAGCHGKQSLTMCMGLGCNAAGVIAARIIDSPRERLLAIVTNNFSLCNGRWPTQILVATIFIGALVPAALAGVVAASAVLGIALLGGALTFFICWCLTRTVLRGEASTFSLELPPYRPPRILQTLYTSLIDRTLFVLWRAVVFALPAGAVIWLIANIWVGDITLAEYLINAMQSAGSLLGLNGVILLAFVIAIPANEIVIPTILMLTVLVTGVSGIGEQGAGVMFEIDGAPLKNLLAAGGWTTLTAVCLMLFSLCHNPCSTTIYTIWKETRSVKWTIVSTFLPLFVGFILCATVALVWRFFV